MTLHSQKRLAADSLRIKPNALAAAFSMVELLVVILVMLTMGALVVPVVNSINSAGNLTQACYEITATLEQARAYAMANNTYVFVGIADADTATSSPGEVALAVVASKDGSKHYLDATSAQGADWQANYANASMPEYAGAHLAGINKLRRLGNVHLSGSVASTGALARPSVDPAYVLGNATCVSQTPFAWPLGSALGGGYQYRFDKVIQFDPQGVVRITLPNNGNTIARWIEIGLVQARGNRVSDSALLNAGAIQIDTLSGATRIYRP